jgi:hypothetical protein
MKSQRLVLGLAALIVLTTGGVARAYFLQGWSDGSTKILSDPSAANTMLQGFSFNFDDTYFDRDHNIERIGILSNSPSPEKTFVQFRDEGADDAYDYWVSQRPLEIAGAITNTAVIDDSSRHPGCTDRGHCEVTLRPPGVGFTFALRGFLARYRNGDHQLKRIAVTESNGVLTIAFHDRNWDDPMRFEVEYVWLPPASVRETGEATGYDEGYAVTTLPAGVRVISGFDFDYASGDNDMYMFRIGGNDQGNLTVVLADAGFDNWYRWRVKWAILR